MRDATGRPSTLGMCTCCMTMCLWSCTRRALRTQYYLIHYYSSIFIASSNGEYAWVYAITLRTLTNRSSRKLQKNGTQLDNNFTAALRLCANSIRVDHTLWIIRNGVILNTWPRSLYTVRYYNIRPLLASDDHPLNLTDCSSDIFFIIMIY